MRRVLGAVQFLTIIPIPGSTVEPARSAIYFPLVGAFLGALGAGTLCLLRPHFPVPIPAFFVVVFWVVVTGAIHEDGLADTADAFRSGRGKDRILEIMKDSRLGTYGVVAIVFSIVFRWQAVAAIPVEPLPALVASQAVSRAALVVLARVSQPVGAGMGGAFCSGVSTAATVLASFQGIAAAFWCGSKDGVAIVCTAAIIVLVCRRYFHWRIGGLTGDCLGATSQIVEIAVLLLLACQNCIW